MLSLARELQGRYLLSLICPPGPGGDVLLRKAERLGMPVLAADALRDVGDWHRARAWLQTQDVDVLYVHAGVAWEGMSAPILARAAGVRATFRHEHLPYLLADAEGHAAYTESMAEVDGILCVSDGVRASLIEAGVSPAMTAVVRNGIAPGPAPRHRPAPERPTFICVARFSEQKNQAALIEAMPAMLAEAPHARVLFVGTGALEADCRARAEALGLGDAAIFLGQRDDVPELMAKATALVLPSLFEGLPLAALEAMAAGLPVVATRVCGSEEVVADGETGLLVPPDDPSALARALVRLALDPAEARLMGECGRARLEADFTAARMARETATHLDGLSSEACPAPGPSEQRLEFA